MSKYQLCNINGGLIKEGDFIWGKDGTTYRFARIGETGIISIMAQRRNEHGTFCLTQEYTPEFFPDTLIVPAETSDAPPTQPTSKYYAEYKLIHERVNFGATITNKDGWRYKFEKVNEYGLILAERVDPPVFRKEFLSPSDFPGITVLENEDNDDERFVGQTIKHFNQWQTVLPLLIDMLNNGTDAVKRVAREELERMARDADRIK